MVYRGLGSSLDLWSCGIWSWVRMAGELSGISAARAVGRRSFGGRVDGDEGLERSRIAVLSGELATLRSVRDSV